MKEPSPLRATGPIQDDGEDFKIRKRPTDDTMEYIRKIEESSSSQNDSNQDIRSLHHSDDAENFTDPAFDSELDLFKMHLDRALVQQQQRSRSRRQRKLRPNVSPRWLGLVRERLELMQLKSYKQNFSSPRTTIVNHVDAISFNNSEKMTEDRNEQTKLSRQAKKDRKREASIATQSTATNNGAAATGRQAAPFRTSNITVAEEDSYASQINLERIAVRFS